jgi:lysophospholipase L1-like esterase
MIGGNDVWSSGSSQQAILNLKKIKSLSRQRNQTLIFVSPPSKNFYSTDSNKLSEYSKIAEWMRSNGDLYVDGLSATNDVRFFTNDKLHLNQNGQRRVAYTLTDALQRV